mgnify:CR=1 FL=1
MNAEKVLTWSVAALGHLKNGANGNAAEILDYLKTEAEAEIRRNAAKQSGNANRQKAAERVIKSAKSTQREALHGSWIDSKGLQCICDGFQAYRLREALPLETIPEKETPLDLSRIIAENRGDLLTLPPVPELKAHIKAEKARKKAQKDKTAPAWDFGEELPQVNAEYLLNALELLPDAIAIASRERPTLRAIYFKSEHGDGILLPVRKA